MHPRYGAGRVGVVRGESSLYVLKENRAAEGHRWITHTDPTGWPDLRDAATRGAVLEALRDKEGDQTLHLVPSIEIAYDGADPVLMWQVDDVHSYWTTDLLALSEIEALVLAWDEP